MLVGAGDCGRAGTPTGEEGPRSADTSFVVAATVRSGGDIDDFRVSEEHLTVRVDDVELEGLGIEDALFGIELNFEGGGNVGGLLCFEEDFRAILLVLVLLFVVPGDGFDGII